jgi:hypothetical protein
MRKVFAGGVAAALIGGLAAASLSVGAPDRTSATHYGTGGDDATRAVARRASATWEGTLKRSGPDTSVKIKFRTKGGDPVELKSLRYVGLPATCPESGSKSLSANPTFSNVFVNNRRKFKIQGESTDGSAKIKFTGKFNRSYKKVRGKLQNTITFGPDDPPEETCVGKTRPYVAKR